MFSDNIFNWLDNALDMGITEYDFWNMTLAELTRAIDSKKRITKIKAQEKASYDYILADLIGRSVARVYSDKAEYPEIYKAYPSLFDKAEYEQTKAEQTMQLSAERMKQFAESFNKRFNNKEAK